MAARAGKTTLTMVKLRLEYWHTIRYHWLITRPFTYSVGLSELLTVSASKANDQIKLSSFQDSPFQSSDWLAELPSRADIAWHAQNHSFSEICNSRGAVILSCRIHALCQGDVVEYT